MCEYTEYSFYTAFEYSAWSYLIQYIWEWLKQKRYSIVAASRICSRLLCSHLKPSSVIFTKLWLGRYLIVATGQSQWFVSGNSGILLYLFASHYRNLDSLLKSQHKNMKLTQWNLQLHNIKQYFSVVIHKISIIN